MIRLVLGGARSGKSSYAEDRILQQSQTSNLYYVATAEGLDEEMSRRIEHHKKSRSDVWRVEEIHLDIAKRLTSANKGETILVDCLTLWLTNVLVNLGDNINSIEADGFIKQAVDELVDALKFTQANVVLVSNEVGLGVMPLGEMTRRYVDHAGWMNQAIAKVAENVVFIAAGLPVALKGEV